MQDINVITLVGRIVKDVELRYTPNGKAVAKFSLANSGRNDTTNWIECVAWNKPAEILAEYGTKGKQLAISGRLETRTYETEDGSKRKVHEVVIDDFQLIGPKPASAAQTESTAAPAATSTAQEDAQAVPTQDGIPF